MFRQARRQLTLWYLTVLALIVGVFAAGTFLATRAVLIQGLDDTNRHLLAPTLEAFRQDDDELVDVGHELAELALDRDDHLALLTARGQVVYARGRQLDPEPPVAAGAVTHRGDPPLRLYTAPLVRDGVIRGYLRIGHSAEAAHAALRGLGLALGLMLPAALLFAWIGGRWLTARALAPIEAALARERELTRDASHELRTPLAVLLNQAQLALEASDATPSMRERLERMVRTLRAMSALVSDLLLLGRADTGLGSAAMRFSLLEVLEEELAGFGGLACDRGMTLVAPAGDEAGWVTGDPSQIARVVRNLLDNALRYGTPDTSVRLGLRRSGGSVLLEVTNSGEPIAPGDRARLFERFSRLEAGRRVNPEGTGLGLALARAIARAHGGDLTLAASDAAATTFELRLPAA